MVKYEKPAMELILFAGEDVITTSPVIKDDTNPGGTDGSGFGD